MDQIFDKIDVQLTDSSTPKVIQNLKTLTRLLTDKENRIALNTETKYWPVLAKLLDNVCQQIDGQKEQVLKYQTIFELIADLCRVLRNSLIDCPKSKQSILTVGSLLTNVCHVFTFLIDCHKESQDFEQILKQSVTQSIKCCLQVMANLLSGSNACPLESALITDHIWKLLSLDLFR